MQQVEPSLLWRLSLPWRLAFPHPLSLWQVHKKSRHRSDGSTGGLCVMVELDNLDYCLWQLQTALIIGTSWKLAPVGDNWDGVSCGKDNVFPESF